MWNMIMCCGVKVLRRTVAESAPHQFSPLHLYDSGLHSIFHQKHKRRNSTYIAYVIHNTIQNIVKTHVMDGSILPIVPFYH
jgi:hypothetical protein